MAVLARLHVWLELSPEEAAREHALRDLAIAKASVRAWRDARHKLSPRKVRVACEALADILDRVAAGDRWLCAEHAVLALREMHRETPRR